MPFTKPLINQHSPKKSAEHNVHLRTLADPPVVSSLVKLLRKENQTATATVKPPLAAGEQLPAAHQDSASANNLPVVTTSVTNELNAATTAQKDEQYSFSKLLGKYQSIISTNSGVASRNAKKSEAQSEPHYPKLSGYRP